VPPVRGTSLNGPPHQQPPWWDLAEEHLSEATFLWSKWEQSLVSPRFTPKEAADREERLRAHLDGLILGGAVVAERLLKPALWEEDPFLVATASLALLDGGHPPDVLLATVSQEAQARTAGLQRALELSEQEELPSRLLAELPRSPPPVQACILGALAARGLEPGAVLEKLLSSPEPVVVSQALKAARRNPSRTVWERVRRLLDSPVPAIQAEALETGMVLGLRDAWTACQRLSREGGAIGQRARLLLALGGEASDLRVLLEQLDMPEPREGVLWALGFSGRVMAAEACLELLDAPNSRVARLAGEAFRAITGLVLEENHTPSEPGDDEDEEDPSEEEQEVMLVLRPEDELPLADASAVRAWWSKARSRFDPTVRYLHGKPARLDAFLEVLQEGPMRRHHVLGLELAIRSRGRFLPQTRTGWRRSAHRLEEIRAGRGIESFLPFKHLCQQG